MAERLASMHVLYDVVVFGDGEILPEFVGDPRRYPRLLLVPRSGLTCAQRELIESFGEDAILVKDLKKVEIPSMLSTDALEEVFFSVNKTSEHTFLHLLNYDYIRRRDEMRPKSFSFSLELPYRVESLRFFGESGRASVYVQDEIVRGRMRNLTHFGFLKMKNESKKKIK